MNDDHATDGIRIEGLTKRFKDVTALDDVNLAVPRGSILALIGPNGAGKSTLLRILGTTVLADAGRAYIAGHEVGADPNAARRNLGLLLGDERSWYWRLSGRHNLEFFAALQGFTRQAAARRASELLEEVGLDEVADRPFGTYSAGMRLRLSLGRALLTGPRVLLLDEPSRSLDPMASTHFRELLVRVTDGRGAAVLFATHDLHEASEVASQIAMLDSGRCTPLGPTRKDAASLERLMMSGQK